MWSTSPSHSEYLLALDDAAFVKELQAALQLSSSSSGKPVPPIQGISMFRILIPFFIVIDANSFLGVVGKRGAFPLKFEHAQQYTGKRVALVGDAAHTVHPMAGQGVNLGMADAHALIAAVNEALLTGQDFGSSQALADYEKKRMGPNNLVMLGVDILKRVYEWRGGWGRLVSGGMSALNWLPGGKSAFKSVATGSLTAEDVKVI